MSADAAAAARPAGASHPTRLRTVDLPGPDSVTWRYAGLWHVVIYSTLRNLVLEVAHPTVGVGVAQHSTYHDEPWKRLDHTFKSYQRYIYGSPHDTLSEARKLRHVHAPIRGVDAAGRRYHALDAEAYFWVHATLFESIVHYHELVGAPLRAEELERCYDEWRSLGVVLGIRADHMPADVGSFRRYFDDIVRNQLEDNAVVRDLLGSAVLNLPAPTPVIPEPLWRALWLPLAYAYTRATVALLPEAYAARLGLRPTRLQSWGTQLVARALHVGTGLLPTGLRYLPKAAVAVLVGQHHRPVEPPHLLALMIDRVPREPLSEDAEAYLAMVEAVLHSRMVADAAVETLCVVVSELGLDPYQVRQLHRDYLAALTKVAVADGTMTNTERDALDAVARLLEQVEAAATRVPAAI